MKGAWREARKEGAWPGHSDRPAPPWGDAVVRAMGGTRVWAWEQEQAAGRVARRRWVCWKELLGLSLRGGSGRHDWRGQVGAAGSLGLLGVSRRVRVGWALVASGCGR